MIAKIKEMSKREVGKIQVFYNSSIGAIYRQHRMSKILIAPALRHIKDDRCKNNY